MLTKLLETTAPEGPNAEQVRYWNDSAGKKWASLDDKVTAQLRPFGEAALARSGIARGHRVLDVGCGGGDTTLAIARAVGPEGTVTGLDISEPMLSVAARAVEQAGLSNVRLLLADAQTTPLPEAAFDHVFSRFGVMFFSDPVAAFRNLRRALVPGGRLTFACWRPPQENPWVVIPLLAAAQHIPIPMPEPHAPGPFALADADRTRGLLAGAGFTDVALTPFDHAVSAAGGGSLDEAVDFLLEIGPAARALRETPDAPVAAVRASIRAAIAPHATESGVALGGAVWIATATNP